MKINKKILLASMLTANLVAAQEYYTCVPKKDWWKSTIKESIKEQKKEEWKFIRSANVKRKKNWTKSLFLAPIGNLKIRLLKGTELIAEQFFKNPEEMSIKVWDLDCNFEKNRDILGTLKYYLYSLELDNIIILNWYTNKSEFNKIIKNKCKDNSESFIFIELSNSILFGVGGGNDGDSMFNDYLKGITIEVWKKVED